MSIRRKLILAISLCVAVIFGVAAVTLIDLTSQVKGTLPAANGGTGNTSNGTNGQVLIGDGSGHFTPQDPIISKNFALLINAQSATAQVVGAATRLSTFSGFGTLYLTFASITGSPSGCSIQLKNYDSLGNGLNNGSTIAVSPANGTTTVAVVSGAALQTAAQMSATFNCSTTFPAAGTVTVDYVPGETFGMVGPIPSGTNTIGAISNFPATVDTNTGNASSNTPRFVLASNQPNLSVLGTLSDNGAAAGSNRAGVLAAIQQSNLPAAGTAGRDAALLTDLNRVLITGQLPVNFATYSAAKTVTAAASPTDVFGMPGNATNTVIVTRAELSCTQTTAGMITATLLTRGTADSGGTSSNTTIGKMDRNNGSAVSVPLSYTANPTLNDGSPTLIREYQIGAMASGTATPNDIAVYASSSSNGQGIVLRGTAQVLYWNFGGTAISGLKCTANFQWIETTGL